jgi:hypothetical protein
MPNINLTLWKLGAVWPDHDGSKLCCCIRGLACKPYHFKSVAGERHEKLEETGGNRGPQKNLQARLGTCRAAHDVGGLRDSANRSGGA